MVVVTIKMSFHFVFDKVKENNYLIYAKWPIMTLKANHVCLYKQKLLQSTHGFLYIKTRTNIVQNADL